MDTRVGHVDSRESERGLLAVLQSPPLTSGQRTLARVQLAAETLGCDFYTVANVFATPVRDTIQLARVGSEADGWLEARELLETCLERPQLEDALLAYGVVPPTGAARRHFKEQEEWLQDSLRSRGIRTWMVGGRPTHPSRWQRATHMTMPGVNFRVAVAHLLRESVDDSFPDSGADASSSDSGV